MTISPKPWTQHGNELRDAYGRMIALFVDPADVTYIVEQEKILKAFNETTDEIFLLLERLPETE